MLFNIHTQQWDKDLLDELRIPPSLLPEVCDSSADFGTTAPGILGGGIRIGGIAGDQQAALIGQVGFTPGTAKSTYGTGCFLILNTGNTPVESAQRLLTTVAYRLNGTATYALEGSIFTAGAAVKWLRDKLGLIRSAHETEAMAARAGNHDSLFLVPAFTGLGAPYWDPDARAALVGMTLDTDADQIVAATLRSVAYQTRDLLEAIGRDGAALTELRVDGGMAANNGFLQTLSDITGVPVRRPGCTETTALGAAYLAGLQAGVYEAPAQLAEHWTCDRSFVPTLDGARRDSLYKGWQGAVQRVLSPPREHSAS
jgi:glycerol kinase